MSLDESRVTAASEQQGYPADRGGRLLWKFHPIRRGAIDQGADDSGPD